MMRCVKLASVSFSVINDDTNTRITLTYRLHYYSYILLYKGATSALFTRIINRVYLREANRYDKLYN